MIFKLAALWPVPVRNRLIQCASERTEPGGQEGNRPPSKNQDVHSGNTAVTLLS